MKSGTRLLNVRSPRAKLKIVISSEIGVVFNVYYSSTPHPEDRRKSRKPGKIRERQTETY
jgi:hypothetical protein